jgi:hypothetical protein
MGVCYSITNLGTPPGVPLTLGGICFLEGEPDTLLIGGNANTTAGVIHAITVLRDGDGHITGFGAPSEFFAAAPGLGNGGIDGSLNYLPGGILSYCSYSDNSLGQYLPGSTAPDKLIDLTALGVVDSVGGHIVVPPGFPGAGGLKLNSYYFGHWYDAEIVPDGNGLYDVVNVTSIVPMGAGPEAMVYVDGDNPSFGGADAMLVAKFDGGRVDYYLLDDNGDPIIGSEYPFINNLFGAEGLAFDPVTGDLLISTFDYFPYGGDEIFVVTGFNPPKKPCPVGDLDGDCLVNGSDLGLLLLDFGGPGLGDLDGSGLVDGADLGILLLNWTG